MPTIVLRGTIEVTVFARPFGVINVTRGKRLRFYSHGDFMRRFYACGKRLAHLRESEPFTVREVE